MKILFWILAIPVAIVVVAFAVANRQPLRFDLWPLPFDITVPTFLAVLGPLVIGLLLGALPGWLNSLRWRRQARRHDRRASAAEAARARLEQAAAPEASPPNSPPSPPTTTTTPGGLEAA